MRVKRNHGFASFAGFSMVSAEDALPVAEVLTDWLNRKDSKLARDQREVGYALAMLRAIDSLPRCKGISEVRKYGSIFKDGGRRFRELEAMLLRMYSDVPLKWHVGWWEPPYRGDSRSGHC